MRRRITEGYRAHAAYRILCRQHNWDDDERAAAKVHVPVVVSSDPTRSTRTPNTIAADLAADVAPRYAAGADGQAIDFPAMPVPGRIGFS